MFRFFLFIFFITTTTFVKKLLDLNLVRNKLFFVRILPIFIAKLLLSYGGGDASGAGEAQLHDVGELSVRVGHGLVVAYDQALQCVR